MLFTWAFLVSDFMRRHSQCRRQNRLLPPPSAAAGWRGRSCFPTSCAAIFGVDANDGFFGPVAIALVLAEFCRAFSVREKCQGASKGKANSVNPGAVETRRQR